MDSDVSQHSHRYLALTVRLALLLASLLAPASAAAAMNIERIIIGTRSGRTNGTLAAFPYDLGIFIHGSGIASVTVTAPNVTSPEACDGSVFFDGGDEWLREFCCYDDLDSIRDDPCLGFGNFQFAFTGNLGESDTVTVAYDPGGNPAGPITGYANFTNPIHEQSGVDLDPNFTWTCSGACGPDGWLLEVGFEPPCDSMNEIVYLAEVPDGVFAWTPGPIAPNCPHNVIAESIVNLSGGPLGKLTDGEDSFIYSPSFFSGNLILFSARERIVLFVEPAGLNWTALTTESFYDVVSGDLGSLFGGGGDFSTATLGCVVNDLASTVLPFSTEPGMAGEGFWFLVRGSMSIDGYDSLQLSQFQDRDGSIASSGVDCP